MGLNGSDAFLLGAGCSHAVSESMPLTNQLGAEVAVQLARYGHDVSILTNQFGGDFEAWMTYLAEGRPWVSEADNLRDRALFLDASHSIADILERSLDRSERPAWLSSLVQYWHQSESVVLILNYDTLIEEAFQSLAPRDTHEQLIHYSSVYAIPITSAKLRRAGVLGGGDPRTMRLLKLHGSINWYYSGSTSTRGETIYEGGLTRGWGAKRTELVGDRDLNLLVDKVPYIVPPTGMKSTFFNNETIRAQWSVGQRFCRGLGSIVIIGYSLPESDRLMRTFLEESMTFRRIILVNSDPKITEHFERLLPTFEIDDRWVEGSSSPGVVASYVAQLAIGE